MCVCVCVCVKGEGRHPPPLRVELCPLSLSPISCHPRCLLSTWPRTKQLVPGFYHLPLSKASKKHAEEESKLMWAQRKDSQRPGTDAGIPGSRCSWGHSAARSSSEDPSKPVPRAPDPRRGGTDHRVVRNQQGGPGEAVWEPGPWLQTRGECPRLMALWRGGNRKPLPAPLPSQGRGGSPWELPLSVCSPGLLLFLQLNSTQTT